MTTTNDYDPSLWSLSETIVRLRRERNEARVDVERLNQMLRETGYGQGQIDAYAAQCEEIERLRTQCSMAETVAQADVSSNLKGVDDDRKKVLSQDVSASCLDCPQVR